MFTEANGGYSYAMEKIYAAGGFGKIIYSEGEYCHTHKPGTPGLSSSKNWRGNGSPMWYPTHATAYYVGVTHGSFTDVSCKGLLAVCVVAMAGAASFLLVVGPRRTCALDAKTP